MKIKEVLNALERFAPLPLQEDYDNAGLQVGLTEEQVSGVLLCIDITPDIIDEAIKKGCNLIVSHHPLIFRQLSCIAGRDIVEKSIILAIKNDIAIASMHTNIDNAIGGVNYKIAEKLGLKSIQAIGPTKQITVSDPNNPDSQSLMTGASGIIGTLPEAMDAQTFIRQIKKTFGVHTVMANQLLSRPIKTVAICGGAGAFMLGEAIKAKADAFITGEMGYHHFFGYEQTIQIAVIGHHQSEQYTNEIFKQIIEEKCQNVTCHLAETNTNPIIYL